MGLTPPPQPPEPDRNSCPADGGIVQTSVGGEYMSVALDSTKEIHGNSQSWTQPRSEEVTMGAKVLTVDGTTDETFSISKLEQISPNESKNNLALTDEYLVGAKYEITPAANKEFHVAVKFHITPMHGRKFGASNICTIGEEKRQLARNKEVIQDFENTILAKADRIIATGKHKVDTLDQRVGRLVEKATKYEAEFGSAVLSSSVQKRVVKSAAELSGATFSIDSKGGLVLKGGTVELKGGGTLLLSGSKVTYNGSDIKVVQ
jgi:hypothetical protein